MAVWRKLEIFRRSTDDQMLHRELRARGCLPSIESSTDKGNFEREKEVEDMMLDLVKPSTEGLDRQGCISSTPKVMSDLQKKIEDKPLEDKPPCWSPTRGETLWLKMPRVRKEPSVPIQEEVTTCRLIIRNIPIVKYAKRRNQSRRDAKSKPAKRLDGNTVHKIWKPHHGRTQNSEHPMKS